MADGSPDPRQALAFEESVRALTIQSSVLDGLRTRTGILLTAIALTASFLGSRALDLVGFSLWAWLAIGFFALAGGFALAVLWPREKGWTFTSSASTMLEGYVTGEDPATIDEMHAELGHYNQEAWEQNGVRLGRLFWFFRLSALALVVQVACWLAALGTADDTAETQTEKHSSQATHTRVRTADSAEDWRRREGATVESHPAGNAKPAAGQ